MPQVDSHTYTLTTSTDLTFDDAVGRVREELAAERFGVLCEIDVQAILKSKLGIEREPYLILGACNPILAHAALEAEAELGSCCRATWLSISNTARHASPPSTRSGCSRSSATTSWPTPRAKSGGVGRHRGRSQAAPVLRR